MFFLKKKLTVYSAFTLSLAMAFYPMMFASAKTINLGAAGDNVLSIPMQITAPASTEALRLISASDWSPLNIRNSANSADIFRVDQTGSLAVGTIPAARITGLGSLATQSSVTDAQVPNNITIDYATAAGTATSLAANGANCSAGYYPLGVNASGAVESCTLASTGGDIYWTGTATNLVAATGRTSLGLGSLATQSSVTDAQVPNNITIDYATAAGTASALAANGANCSAGYYPLGVNASGAVESCTLIPAGSDIYWNGSTGGGFVAATGRTSLGLGSLATQSSVTSAYISNGTIVDADVSSSAAISASKIQYGTYFINSAGTNGQVWTSDGSGVGGWATPASSGLTASGTTNYVSKWTGPGSLGNSAIYDNSRVGIGTTAPGTMLDVNGSLRTNSSVTFSIFSGGGTRVLGVDNGGTLTTISASLPSGSTNDTLRYNGLAWVSNSNLISDSSGNVSSQGIINARSGFSYNGTAGQEVSYAPDTVPTGLLIWGGIVVGSSGVTGLTSTVSVRNADNSGSCDLVFTKGILVSTTCSGGL